MYQPLSRIAFSMFNETRHYETIVIGAGDWASAVMYLAGEKVCLEVNKGVLNNSM